MGSSMTQPTMDDVAAKAGVSRSLVSLVMSDSPRVSDQSRTKVVNAAQELGYRPNLWARSLASGRTMTVGVMVNDLHNPFFTEMAEGVAESANGAGLEVLVTSGWQRVSGERAAIDSLLNLRVDGIVLGGARVSTDLLEDYSSQAPLVAVNAFVEPSTFDTVKNHEAHGAELAVEHLAGLGHKRIAHINSGNGAGAPERRSAFTKAMMNRGLAPIVIDGDFNETSGYEAAGMLFNLTDPPTAVFAGNDLSAIGVMTYLAELGVDVPGDVSIVGYDDTILAAIGTVSLTTIHQPRQQLGRRAMELLCERIGGRTEAVHEFVEPHLVTRASTSKAPER